MALRLKIETGKNMNILYDLTAVQPRGATKYHGGGEYGKAVFKALLDSGLCKRILCIYFAHSKLDDWIHDLICHEKITAIPIKSFNDIWAICEEEKIDIFYSALPIAYKKRPVDSKVRMKGTIHGLRYIECPKDAYAVKYYSGRKKAVRYIKNLCYPLVYRKHKLQMERVLAMLDSCICVSEHTKYALRVNFPDFQKNIEVLYTPQKEAPLAVTERIRGGNENYILLISANRWMKNAYRAICAIDELYQAGFLCECKAKVVGSMPAHALREIKCKDRFEFLDYVSADELEALYRDCTLFVYPSLNEGFGMPPVEAMKYGTTCVVSAVCSLPEIYGDAVYYFNPRDIPEMKARLLYAYENQLDKDMVKKKEQEIKCRQERDLRKICEFIICRE